MSFEEELNIELLKHSDSAISLLRRLFENIPSNAREVHIEIFPSQDGDGLFSVYVSLDGPDLYVLNKSIQEFASIFDPKCIGTKIEPYIPTIDPFDADVGFDVNDVVVDCAAKWVQLIWSQIGDLEPSLPVRVFGQDGYGSLTPIDLRK
ncbi:hypothetical protein BCV39_22365 [Vibrio sp. 10N.286.55.E10]|uniref:DUF6389 family protein n=1 Tax=unclassified Vibrio TaxID=2614977 RepID=UPI000C815901|nr:MULTISPECIES: DUF6389 family protein [unclassified Vibrio]PME31439.1 hypothetical protein BCV39_22365 [Vibrio sp. 10N.286.55.E10]PME40720.1 hypothetical protein BCV40_22205 [Vibrio sp. 10N.286.55.E12]PME61506.1 hypothetical protein BCV32_22300 [Vibrio sp. 10N.286.55.C11]